MQELDSYKFRNAQLTKRVEILQDLTSQRTPHSKFHIFQKAENSSANSFQGEKPRKNKKKLAEEGASNSLPSNPFDTRGDSSTNSQATRHRRTGSGGVADAVLEGELQRKIEEVERLHQNITRVHETPSVCSLFLELSGTTTFFMPSCARARERVPTEDRSSGRSRSHVADASRFSRADDRRLE